MNSKLRANLAPVSRPIDRDRPSHVRTASETRTDRKKSRLGKTVRVYTTSLFGLATLAGEEDLKRAILEVARLSERHSFGPPSAGCRTTPQNGHGGTAHC